MRDDLGWSIEFASPGSNPDMGEMNNTGDILDTAMILGRWGYTHISQRGAYPSGLLAALAAAGRVLDQVVAESRGR